ncbi:mRNA splicing protein, partial [Coemansia sp. RSA 2052]
MHSQTKLLQQVEHYVKYSRAGKVVSGAGKPAVGTRFKEDVHPLNHSTVCGSWWSDGKWGYKRFQQFPQNAYCTAGALD